MSCPWTAGPYTATWNSLSLGQTRPDEGFRAQQTVYGEGIKGSQYGQTDQDIIHMGSDAEVSMTLVEFPLALAAAIFTPWDVNGRVGLPGRLAKCGSFAKALVLTPLAGTAASGIRTYPLTILAPGFPVDYAFRPGLREVPLRLKALPATSGADLVFFVDT